jgi:hypothetical protein
MAATSQNAVLYRGTSVQLRWVMKSNGSVSGWTVRLSIREHAKDPDPLVIDAAASIEDAGSVSTPGVFSVSLSKGQTLGLSARKYAYSLERTDSGAEDLLAIGVFDVRLDVRNAS